MTVTRRCLECRKWFTRQSISQKRASQRRFCGRVCQGLYTSRMFPISPEKRAEGLAKANENRRKKTADRLAGLTPMEIYKRGYQCGWQRGVKYARGDAFRTGAA